MTFLLTVGFTILLFLVLDVRRRLKVLEAQGVNQKSTVAQEPQSSPSTYSLPQALLTYVETQLHLGENSDSIKTALLAKGWEATEVDQALLLLSDSQKIVSLPDQPVPVSDNKPSEPSNNFSNQLISWVKEDWLLKLGALLLLIGFGWLVSYAFANNWIGPMGRITLGIMAGAVFILLGYWRIQKFIHQGGIFLVLGSTIILLTVFAAREIYDFFTPFSALIIMFLSTVLVALASVKYRNRILAFSSLILATIAPLFTSAAVADYVSLFTYLLFVILGTIWVVALTGYRELTVAGLIVVVCYSLPHLFGFTSSDGAALLLLMYGFTIVFFLSSTFGIIKNRDKAPADLIAAGGNGLLLILWIMMVAPDEWKSFIISAWMLVFAIGAFLVYRSTGQKRPLYVYAGVSIVMLGAATSAELTGSALTIAYTLESAAIVVIGYILLKDYKIAEHLSYLMAVPILLSLDNLMFGYEYYDSYYRSTSGNLSVLLILALTLFGLGFYFRYIGQENTDKSFHKYNTILLISGSAYIFRLIWLWQHEVLLGSDIATMICLIIYIIVGLACYFYGLFNQHRVLRMYGTTLLALTIARLVLIDVWDMDLTGRIITFFLIGILLMSTAFLRKNKINNNPPSN